MSNKKTKKLEDIQKVTLSITETKEVIKHQFRQVVKFGPKYHGLMYFIEGEPGVGKTQLQAQIMKEIAHELKEEFGPKTVKNASDLEHFNSAQKGQGHLEVLNLAAKDSQDFSGLPMIDAKTKLQTFAHPDTLPTEGYGIIFYDEANRVFDIDMKATLLSLWMDRGVNGHYLGEGYIQVAAGNPFDDDRFETDKPDAALSERFRIIRMVPTVDEVIAFLTARYEKHFLLNFLKENKDFCNLVGGESGFSPRLIDKTMEICFDLKDAPEKNLTLIKTLLGINLGQAHTAKIMQFLNNKKVLSFEKIVENVALADQIKKTDMPVMTKLSEEIFAKLVANYDKKKMALTKDEKKAMVAIGERLNAESKAVVLTKISQHPDDTHLFDFIAAENKEFLKTLHSMTDKF